MFLLSLVFWKILERKPSLEQKIEQKFGLSRLASKVLAARFDDFELVSQNLKNFEVQSRFSLSDMNFAVSRLKKAVLYSEKIAIYGDYDCDGVCGCAILFSYLKSLGANVLCHIPDRSEGYGLNCAVIEKLKEDGVELIVTVDNGITALNEADFVSKLGMDLIITDHHNVSLQGKPECAVAVVNPKRVDDSSVFKEICGAVVVLKLVAAMENGNLSFAFNFAGDLAAIATVADLVPLGFENKKIVLEGVEKIKKTSNVGLFQLLKLVFPNGVDSIDSTDLAFKICPLINAAGRVEKASLAFELLTCTLPSKAFKLANQLVEINSKRKKMQVDLIKRAKLFIENNPACLSQPILVIYGKKWPSGLVGLVAGNLMHEFKKPVVVLSIEGELAVGSARSFESLNIYDALQHCSELFIKWGGHNLAGGLTIEAEKIEQFVLKINNYVKLKNFAYILKVDLVVDFNQLRLSDVKSLSELEPFGNFNERPIFLIKNLILARIVPLKHGQHLKLVFQTGLGEMVKVLAFNWVFDEFYYETGQRFDVVVNAQVECFLGVESVSLVLLGLRLVEFNQKKLVESFWLLQKIERGESLKSVECFEQLRPSRAEFALVFLKIKRLKVFRGSFFDLFCLICKKVSCFKVFVVLSVLVEMGLVEFNGLEYRLKNNNSNTKIDLKQSRFLGRLFG